MPVKLYFVKQSRHGFAFPFSWSSRKGKLTHGTEGWSGVISGQHVEREVLNIKHKYIWIYVYMIYVYTYMCIYKYIYFIYTYIPTHIRICTYVYV